MSLLAERIDELLDEVLRRTGDAAEIPETAPAALRDDGPLDLPLTEDFRVGAIALAWDSDGDRVVIEAQEESDAPVEPLSDDIPVDGPGVLRVRISPSAARAFAQRALEPRRGRPSAVPAVRAAARRERPRLPAAERPPGRPCLTTRCLSREAGTPTAPEGEREGLDCSNGATLTVEGRLVDASNATLYCTVKSARRARRTASTSRSRVSGRCGTSRTARWPAARSPPTWCPGRPAGTSCRPRSSATARSAPACASCGSTSTRPSTWSRSPAARTTGRCGDGGLRRGHQQRRQEERPPAARRRRPLYGSTTGLLRRGVQAAHVLWQWRGEPLPEERGAGDAAPPSRRPGGAAGSAEELAST